MNNKEQIFYSEKYHDSKGYKYLASQLDNFILAQKSKSKLTSEVFFKHLLKIIYSIAPYQLFYWSVIIQILFCSVIFYIYSLSKIYQFDFPLNQSTFESTILILWMPIFISILRFLFEKIKKAKELPISIIDRFANYKVINDNDTQLLAKLVNNLDNDFFTLEDLSFFEIDLKKLINDRNKSQKIILVIMPLFVILFFICLPTISGLNIDNITQKFAQLSGGFSLIVTVIAVLTFLFNIEPIDIALYERFLHILSKVKIKANL